MASDCTVAIDNGYINFEPVCDSFTDDESKERLVWVDSKSDITYYPAFFGEELKSPSTEVKHIVTDNRR